MAVRVYPYGCSFDFFTSVHCPATAVDGFHCPLSAVTLFGGPLDQALEIEGYEVTSVSGDDPLWDEPRDFCRPTNVRRPSSRTRRDIASFGGRTCFLNLLVQTRVKNVLQMGRRKICLAGVWTPISLFRSCGDATFQAIICY